MSKKNGTGWRSFLLEILSIFIGITAAFWLDSWNKNRIAGIEEIKILKELKNGLQSTLEDMESNAAGHLTSIRASRRLVEFINGESTTTDSVHHFYTLSLIDYTFTPNTGAYETLKSRGVQLITNDSIRLEIINTYDFTFLGMVRLEEEEEAFEFYKNYSPALSERLSQMKVTYYRNNALQKIEYPKGYRKRQDHEFMFLTNNVVRSRGIMSNFYHREGAKVRALIAKIDEEVKQLGG